MVRPQSLRADSKPEALTTSASQTPAAAWPFCECARDNESKDAVAT